VTFLVDANVLSETTKKNPAGSVVDWLRRHETHLVTNPIVVGELEFGILLLPPGRRRTRLLQWFGDVIASLHVLEIDCQTARVWATLLNDLRRMGRAMPLQDSLIAATALQHDLTVVTRNTTDYRYARVEIIDPFRAK